MNPQESLFSSHGKVMRTLRAAAMACCLALPSLACGQKQGWLPVTAADLGVKEVPGSPGAAAVQLYYSQNIDDYDSGSEGEYIYRRIKILTETGNKYADIVIKVPPDYKLADLKARTIHPDGKIIDFTGKPFDKVIAKGRGFTYLAKCFSLPDVTVGSVIEYRYKLEFPPDTLVAHEWVVQHDLFTIKEDFRVQSYTGPIEGVENQGLSLFQTLPKNAKVQQKGDGFELHMENVPAFEAEPDMPPPASYVYHVTMAYGGNEMTSAEAFWSAASIRWNGQAEHFMGDSREVRETAAEATKGESDPERKLHRLYDRVQRIRNLSFERERSEEEEKKENLKPNQSAADVLSRGYGNSIEITRLFVALARAAGFESSLLRTGNRAERLFDRGQLYTDQLDGEIALIKVNGIDFFLDPGTRFCPYGALRWTRTSGKALKLDNKGRTFVDVPAAAYSQAVINRTADVVLDVDGSLRGELLVQYNGSEALERRLEAMTTDEPGRKKILEDDVLEWLPAGASATLKDAQAWESGDDPLEARFEIIVPGYASLVGKRLLAPACLFRAKMKDAFKQQERKFPVYFPFAFTENDRLNIKVPSGVSVESVPQRLNASIGYAVYQTASQFDGKHLVTQRLLRVNGFFFRPDQYTDVKGFFGKVQAGDEQQAVLQGGGVHVQESN